MLLPPPPPRSVYRAVFCKAKGPINYTELYLVEHYCHLAAETGISQDLGSYSGRAEFESRTRRSCHEVSRRFSQSLWNEMARQ
jgi:hypothetical protein